MPPTKLTRRSLLGSAAFSLACQARRPPTDGKVHLSLQTWGLDAELAAFGAIAQRYEQLHPHVHLEIEPISYKLFNQQLDTRLAAGVGPDLFRLQYTDIGRYTSSHALVDLSPYVPDHTGEEFSPAVWPAVLYHGRPYALPHHTDTSAIQYNCDLFQKIGINAPRERSQAWTWQEFEDVARRIKRHTGGFAFAMNWTYNGAFRWLNFLHQHGGQLLAKDLKTPAIPSREATETLEWTRSWFRDGLVPASDSVKASETVANLFSTGVVGMVFDNGLQDLEVQNPAFAWDITFLPRDRSEAAELGGNAIAVSRDCRHPEIAADVARFITNEENMRYFVTAAGFVPVRRKLTDERLSFSYHPKQMQVYVEQAQTMPLHLVQTVTSPGFFRMQRVLADELMLALSGNQSGQKTLENIRSGIEIVSQSLT